MTTRSHLVAAAAFVGFALSCAPGSTRNEATLRIWDKEVLGGTFQVCSSNVQFSGTEILIEGIEVPNSATATKAFSVGKVGMTPKEIHKLNSMTLGVADLFRQMCTSSRELMECCKEQVPAYIVERDKTALKVFDVLAKMERANLGAKTPEDSINAQEALYDQNLLPGSK